VKSEVGVGKSIVLIHSNALAYKYAVVAKVLHDAGFKVIGGGTLPRAFNKNAL